MIETATFWKDGPEIETGELRTEDIGTEVFFLPAAAHSEKDGTFTNTQRLLQWHHKAVEPPGDCRSDLWFVLRARAAHQASGSPAPTDRSDRPIQRPDLGLPRRGPARRARTPTRCSREINGIGRRRRRPSAATPSCKDDGSTTCGCWIYSGVYADEVNQATRRKPGRRAGPARAGVGLGVADEPARALQPGLGRPRGSAVERAQGLVWWDEDEQRWTGDDVPDFPADNAAGVPPARGRPGARTPSAATSRSSCRPTAACGCYVPTGLADGPMPVHYEPEESPMPQRAAPAARGPTRPASASSGPTTATTRGPRHAGRRGLPVRVHHVPHRRAPHRGRDEPVDALPRRAGAGDVRRGLPGAGRRARPGAHGVGDDRDRAVGDRGAGGGHRADEAAAHRRRDRSTRWACRGTGARTAWSPATRPTRSSASALDPNVHIMDDQDRHLRRGGRAPPAGPALLSFVDGYRRRAGLIDGTG